MARLITVLNIAILLFAWIQFFSAKGHASDVADHKCPTDEPIEKNVRFHARLSLKRPSVYKAGTGSWIKALDKSKVTMPTGTPVQMQFAEIHTEFSDIREVHWHINSGEWTYVKAGTCEFTLMDNEGRYNIINATVGDVWYFPKGWQHSFQAVDRQDGCDLLLWFDTSDVNIDMTKTIGEVPPHVLRRSLNDIPTHTLHSLIYPLYDKDKDSPQGILKGTRPTSPPPQCVRGEKNNPCTGSLKNWPAFAMKGGKRNEVPGAGIEYKVKNDLFPATLTMSGGLLELASGAIREIHWHPDSEEQHYVLKGIVRVTVFGIDQDSKKILKDRFSLHEGDLGIVPINYIHYIEALEDSTLVVTFNSPNWQTQTLSQTFVTTPTHVNVDTLNTTEHIADNYFPKDFVDFIPPP